MENLIGILIHKDYTDNLKKVMKNLQERYPQSIGSYDIKRARRFTMERFARAIMENEYSDLLPFVIADMGIELIDRYKRPSCLHNGEEYNKHEWRNLVLAILTQMKADYPGGQWTIALTPTNYTAF